MQNHPNRRQFLDKSAMIAAGCAAPLAAGFPGSAMQDEFPASNVRITVLRKFHPKDVFDTMPVTVREEEPLPCPYYTEGQSFLIKGEIAMPEGFCPVAWHIIFPTIRVLAFGGNFPWFKEKGVGVNACIDGLRPVIFKLERV